MREIKFRVRDGASKKVLGFEYFNASLNNGYYYIDLRSPVDDGEGGETYMCKTELSEQPMLRPERPTSRLIREQYTGLKDQNGVEIYEGDIIEFHPYLNMEHEQVKNVSAVSWGQTGDSNGWDHGKHYEWCARLNSLADVADSDYKETMYCKVVGNIYENPELLGEKQ